MTRIFLLLIFTTPLTGCYYLQAASGQWEVMRKREPLQDVIDNPATAPELAARLRLLGDARDFSIADLGLPDNKSYRTYAEIPRDYVVWNVFAAPEFSLQPKQWCFPVAGCVSYRGYFSEADAMKKSEQLAEDGYDVAVGGVAAYSTLGRFSDPILSTMMNWDDIDLVAVLFHELAHQVVYVKDDSAFNESFATAVEEFGIERWLASRSQSEQLAAYNDKREFSQRLTASIETARRSLQTIYESDESAESMRLQKLERLAQLVDDIAVEFERSGRTKSAWFSVELNNAHLISTSLYKGLLPSFRAIYQDCGQDINCFYTAAERLADMDKAERDVTLLSSDQSNDPASDLLRIRRSLDAQ